jgi:hypothetical protein
VIYYKQQEVEIIEVRLLLSERWQCVFLIEATFIGGCEMHERWGGCGSRRSISRSLYSYVEEITVIRSWITLSSIICRQQCSSKLYVKDIDRTFFEVLLGELLCSWKVKSCRCFISFFWTTKLCIVIEKSSEDD